MNFKKVLFWVWGVLGLLNLGLGIALVYQHQWWPAISAAFWVVISAAWMKLNWDEIEGWGS